MPVTPEMNELLAKILQMGPAKGPSNSDLARTMLLGASADYGNSGRQTGSDAAGPSVVSRIFDVLSRPNYAVANIFDSEMKKVKAAVDKDGFQIGDLLQAYSDLPETLGAGVEGLEGQRKTTFQNVLQNAGMEPGFGTAALGFGADILLDPTTYIGAGAVKGVGKGIMKAIGKGGEIAEDVAKPELLGRLTVDQGPKAAPLLENMPTKVEPGMVHPYANQFPPSVPPVGPGTFSIPGKKVIPKQLKWMTSPDAVAGIERAAAEHTGEEGYKKAFSTFMQEAKKSKGPQPKKREFRSIQDYAKALSEWRDGKLAPKPPVAPVVNSAEDLVDGISRGDIESSIRVAPNPPSTPVANPDETRAAVEIARRYLGRASKTMPDKNLNPSQQLAVFKKIWDAASPGSPVERMSQAVTMLREAEKYFRSQGYSMKYWDGMHLKLSNLIDEMGGPTRVGIAGFSKLLGKGPGDAVADAAIEALRARSAMQDTPIVKLGLDQMVKHLSAAEQVLSPAKLEDFKRNTFKELQEGLAAADVSPGSIRASQDVLKRIANRDVSGPQKAINSKRTTLIRVVSGGKPAEWQDVNSIVTHQIDDLVGVSSKVAGTLIGTRAKALESLGTRFATYYGMKDLRPTQLDYVLSAEANAEKRHRAWRGLIRSTSPDERADSFRIAQNKLPATNPQADQIAQMFRKSMDELFRSSGVTDETNSVAMRSGLLREDLNKELKRVGSENYFDNTGQYANGTDWLKSWEAWDVKGDPMHQIAKLETAVERLVKRNALYDDISAKWGSRAPGGEFRYKIGHPRFEGVYFSRDMVPQIQRMMSHLDSLYEPKSPLLKYFDEVLSIWKTYVTIYSPAHHIRNAIGDAWLSWIAGVNNPDSYRKAAKIMNAQRGRYDTMMGVQDLVGAGAQQYANARGGRTLIKTASGKPLTADQIYVAAHRRGLLLNARQIEDIFGEPLIRGRIQPFGGRVHDTVASVSQNREHFFRLAHFVDAVKKSRGADIEKVFDEAAHTVRKWHPDGMDLTGFERKYLRRIFPFYSWSRKAVPLIVEAIVMKPGKVLAYPKGMEALQVAMGIEAPSRTDPFPTDQLFPDWIREKGIGPIGLSGAGGLTGLVGDVARQGVEGTSGYDIGGYSIVNPSNPMIDTISQLGGGNPLQTLIENMNPLAKVPIEVGMNSSANTGAPIYGTEYSDPVRYATEQLPIIAQLSRLTNIGLTGTTGKGEREGIGNLESLINQLSAAGLLGTGPFIKQAEFEQRNRQG